MCRNLKNILLKHFDLIIIAMQNLEFSDFKLFFIKYKS